MLARKSRVLLIEDDVDLCEMLTSFLTERGYLVDFVHDGPSAITFASRHAYDAVITDLGLPNIDGIDVIKAIKLSPNNAGTPILVASGQLDDHRVEALTRLRVITMIAKPYVPSQIEEELKKFVPKAHKAKGYSGQVIDLFTKSTSEIIDFYVGQKSTAGKAEIRITKDRLGTSAATIDLFGRVVYGYLNFACNDTFLSMLGAKAFGGETIPPDQLVGFTGELANQIAGKIRQHGLDHGLEVVIGLPFVHKRDNDMIPRKLPTPAIHIPFTFASGAEAHIEFGLGEPDDLVPPKDTTDFQVFVYE